MSKVIDIIAIAVVNMAMLGIGTFVSSSIFKIECGQSGPIQATLTIFVPLLISAAIVRLLPRSRDEAQP